MTFNFSGPGQYKGNFGGENNTYNDHAPAAADVAAEVAALRRSIEALDPAPPGREEALADLAAVERAAAGAAPAAEAERGVGALRDWAKGLDVVVNVARLGDLVHRWIS